MIVEARSGRGRPDLAGVDLAAAVTSWLSSQRSSFRQTDVLVALAACACGFSAGEAERWTERFCEAAIPVRVAATSAPRWTTPAAEVADCRLVDRAQLRRALRPASPRPLPDAPVEAEVLTAAAFTKHPGLSPPGRAAVGTLITDCDGLHILAAPPGRTNLLAQGGGGRGRWLRLAAAGRRVIVATSSEQAAARTAHADGSRRLPGRHERRCRHHRPCRPAGNARALDPPLRYRPARRHRGPGGGRHLRSPGLDAQ